MVGTPISARPRGRAPTGLLVAGTVLVAAALAALAVRDRPGGSGPALHFERSFPDEFVGTVWFTVEAQDDSPRTVTATWQVLQRRFEHRGRGPTTYLVTKGAGVERAGPLVIDVDPGAKVTFSFGTAPPGAIDLSSQPWRVLPTTTGTVPPRPANADAATATASVDENVSYGGRDSTGIGVRPEPDLAVERLTRVAHATVLTASCWRTGQEITTGNLADPADDDATYTSTVWFMVETPAGPGLIPDAWFSRRGLTDKLNLPPCPMTPPA